MNSTPLVELNDAGLVARSYDLGLKIVSNLKNVLTREELEHWENNLGGVQTALRKGFSFSQASETPETAQPSAPELLLEPVGTGCISATTTRFVAKDRFVLDTGDEAKVKISYLGDNLKVWFLKGKGKIEEPITELGFRYGKLRQGSLDGPILTELGGNDKAETTLTEVFSLMEKQSKGEKGALLNNGRANIFYIKDQNNVLRTVHVFWSGVGWGVGADSVEYPGGWGAVGLVFSRNSVLESSAPVSAQA